MKQLILCFSLPLIFGACSPSHTSNETQAAKEAILDSISMANHASLVQKRTIDSMSQVNQQRQPAYQHHHAARAEAAPQPAAKKGLNNTKKGALIGAGAGILTGAITGAAVSHDKGKGAVIGGLIGGAAGAGAGAITGKTIDKKKEENAPVN